MTTPLVWTQIKFHPNNRAIIPRKRGIYAFTVRHENDHFPPHGFVMYIGITGGRSAGRTLHLRYGDYLREKIRNKRPRVYYMLNKYEHDLFFCYVCIEEDQDVDLNQLELDLNDSILPPVVVKDFTAEIRTLVRALWE